MLWPPDVKNQLIGKDPDAGKDGRQEEKGMTEDEMVGWHQDSMDMSLSKLQELVMPTISSSVITFSSCLQSFPASGSFPMSQLFASSGLSIGASASMNIKVDFL